MTEEIYQEGRKVMQRANYLRGKITLAKNDVLKWTRIESSYLQNMQQSRADGAKKILIKTIERLEKARTDFAELNFPWDNRWHNYEQGMARALTDPVILSSLNLSRWVSVDDKRDLKDWDNILVTNGEYITSGYLCEGLFRFDTYQATKDDNKTITHWMPLPQPPIS